ncbi:Y-family DNA polymerase [Rufibacter glacialis]|uniref:Y-family DNA polymerase n=1 Tax=Rufibacter glacialis TaxID=1259555 RepID=A0A5M8QK30_9BACT|nr:Y-family DNA polymerase [Rufibacter glacialis]KAA6435511.1 Y-family DNA polymerase [Rufibacter glacialis]GGK64143.1 SOS mutagenesis and repair protein UmuC [Rufibacter glacialis]
MTSLFALVDCNNFYASCERLFNPDLIGKPIVVLSNNDGCVIARSNEAKALGIKMGAPLFEIKDLLARDGVHVFSSNYELYGDMSRRVVLTLSEYSPNVEVYSIDESFLDLGNFLHVDIQAHARAIWERVPIATGIPVAVGVAATKTLAKLANRLAKKSRKANGVLVLTDPVHVEAALKATEIGDVWGVGRQYARKLALYGVRTAYDLTRQTDSFVKRHMTIVGLRTVKELRGEPCIDLEMVPPSKQNICTSRSFGQPLIDLSDIEEALATHAVRCATKLRKQGSCASALTVFLETSRFAAPGQVYFSSRTVQLESPSASELVIMPQALGALRAIFRSGFRYKRTGIIVTGICPAGQVQQSLFEPDNRKRDSGLMDSLDTLRKRFGHSVVKYGVQGTAGKWEMQSGKLSPCYTTRLDDLIKAR